MKKCKIEGCNSPIFGGLICKYHQYTRRMIGGDLFKKKPRQKSIIPKESKKRAKDNRSYLVRVKEFWDKSVAEGTNGCIFCEDFLDHFEGNHHIRGRGKYFLEPQFWSLAHFICHDDYHHKSIEYLARQPWWGGFLSRIRALDMVTYRKILNKIERNSELNLDN